MSALLIIIFFGIVFSIIATQNTIGVPVYMFNLRWPTVPLYLVALLSLLIGVLLSWILSFFGWMSTAFTLRGKNSQIKKTENTVMHLEKKVAELEKENTSLRSEKEEIHTEAKEKIAKVREENPNPPIIERIRRNI